MVQLAACGGRGAQRFEFGILPAYNAALSEGTTDSAVSHGQSRMPAGTASPTWTMAPWKRGDGRTFTIQEHHAPQGPAGRGEIQAVQQAGAGSHRRSQDGASRPRHECAPAR